MEKNYITFTAADLLTDDYFLESEQCPTEESKLFWAQLEAEHRMLAHEMIHARSLLKAVAHSSGRRLSSQEVSCLWLSIQNRTIVRRRERKIYRLLWKQLAVAACITFLFIGGWMVFTNVPNANEEFSKITSVKRPDLDQTDEIQLILSETKKLTINGEDSKVLYGEGKIAVNSQTIQMEENNDGAEEYNQFIVPAGKRSSITFRDGTKVMVNANTRIVYPAEFATNQREIFVEGEIYLEVSPDANRPFIVKTNQLDVRVLGTKFNVNAYTEKQSVVLISGSVEVGIHHHTTQRIKPNEMLAYADNQLRIQTVNVANYISWINGYCVFEEEGVAKVVDKLSQFYKKKILVSSRLDNVTCSGKLNLRDSVEEVLETLAQIIPAQVERTGENAFLIK